MRLYAIQRLESVYITGVVCPKKNTKYSQGLPRTAAREVYTKYGNVAEKPECPVNSCISLREMPNGRQQMDRGKQICFNFVQICFFIFF